MPNRSLEICQKSVIPTGVEEPVVFSLYMPTASHPSKTAGAVLGAVRRYFMRPSPEALPARFLKKSEALSMTPTFPATATAIHRLKDTPSSFASRWAAFLMDMGSFKGNLALLILLSTLPANSRSLDSVK